MKFVLAHREDQDMKRSRFSEEMGYSVQLPERLAPFRIMTFV
ncbi:hypothetical protein X744_32090 [Mesorhizobium sp. LNJC372A00]|nr:hypothetical protein X745_32090 [Mesorhizobium sp. LNJC374B00]ESY49752.1 hypothetical protein X744_32090 [Mesorhizobium sp. LNJC372A00]